MQLVHRGVNLLFSNYKLAFCWNSEIHTFITYNVPVLQYSRTKKNEGTRGKIYFKMSKALEVLPAEMNVVYFPLVFENNLLVLTFFDLHLFFAALIFHEVKKKSGAFSLQIVIGYFLNKIWYFQFRKTINGRTSSISFKNKTKKYGDTWCQMSVRCIKRPLFHTQGPENL